MTHRIPVSIQPEIAFIAIQNADFETDVRWRGLVDLLARHGPYNVLTVTMRCKGHPITEPDTHALFARLVAHARRRGLEVALDLDPRLARSEFRRRYPDELQRIVYLQRCAVVDGAAQFAQQPEVWQDHMTWGGTPYEVEAGRFVRALAWRLDADGLVVPQTARDVTAAGELDAAGPGGVCGRVGGVAGADEVVVLTEFSLFTPDVFSPHLVAYQRELLERYADLPLAGVVKDEWGFPPTVDSLRTHRAFWYSPGYEQAYQQASGGRCLLDDLPLLAVAAAGRQQARAEAINTFMAVNLRRQALIEAEYYDGVRAVFGAAALVTKHPTWYPRINDMEFAKNGLSWWAARRDIAQTDEITPVSAALGMAKKFGSPFWLNEGYADRSAHYRRNLWRYALAGGRMVFHSLYPTVEGRAAEPGDPHHSAHSRLLTLPLLRAECRIRLLSFITRAPLDCPVAFVFGHERVMNWGDGGYLDYGEELSLDLWRNGYAVDLFPSSEIVAGSFAVDAEGWVRVGCQRYELLVLYGPDLCPPAVADFFRGAGAARTGLLVVGPWTRDDRGRDCDGLEWLPPSFRRLVPDGRLLGVLLDELARRGAARQPPLAEPYLLFGSTQVGLPAPSGTCRLVDGTVVCTAATTTSDAGDPIEGRIALGDASMEVAAEGLVAARLGPDGRLEALAAGGLRYLRGPGLELELPQPLDLALWRRPDGPWEGAVQGTGALPELPPALRALTSSWTRLSVPPACEPQ